MVLVGTQLFVSDNSGAIKVNCIKILGSSFCNHTNIGDILVVSIRHSFVRSKTLSNNVYKSVLIRQKSVLYRKVGLRFSFYKNSVVLIKARNEPIGNRVLGCTLQELRYKKFLKVMLLSWNTI